MMKSVVVMAFAAVAALAGCAPPVVGPEGPRVETAGAAGPRLVDQKGMTLYTYDGDQPDSPYCASLCALQWPPLEAYDGALPHGDFAIVSRASGARQWVYKRAPLYGNVWDKTPGETRGDGEDGVWHTARP
jgi:predicted lipoprotein with Yx(FWY)xxD motif